MGSKRKRGVSTFEEDGGSDEKKSPVWKTFRIYSSEFVTSSNRDARKKAAVKIALYEDTTERKLREILVRELPQLRCNW